MSDIRTLLRLDALTSAGLGVALLALARVLDDALGLTVILSVVAGIVLLAWAGFVTWVSMECRPALVREVVVLNVVWVVASIVFAVVSWGGLTGWGVLCVLAQAVALAGLTILQVAARRALRSLVAA